jgi:hypothetical protein
MGLHYWKVDIDIPSDTHAGLNNECNIEHHCLLLPQLTKSGLPAPGSEPYFAIIDSQWLDVAPDPVTGKSIFKKPKINY